MNTPLRRALRHPSFVIGALLCLLLGGAALLSLVWTPHPPTEIDIPKKLQGPSASHWLGTDTFGRDTASQLMVGAQNSIVVGVIAVGIGLVAGVLLGCIASARRGWVEEVVMRAADFTFAFPALLSAIMLTAIYGPGLVMSIVAIGIFNIPVFARITRAAANAVWSREYVLAARAGGKGAVRITWDHVLPNIANQLIVQATISFATAILAEAALSVWARDFVTASRACGKGAWHITMVHVLPNIASVLIVQSTIQFAVAILAEAALSYLGLGTQPPQPSWGRMLNEAQTQLFVAPQLAIYPGVAIALSVLGLNLMGDGLRDLLDPKLARQR